MSERYLRLFRLPENLYCEGAPVIVEAGALLKDNQTGNALIQLKFKNIQSKKVKAITVKITPMDIVGQELGDVFEYQYLDFDEERDSSFGAKIPVVLPNVSTREFDVIVTKVIFADHSTWEHADEEWEALGAQVTLEDGLMGIGIVEQYRLEYGENCKYMYEEKKDLWRCACGAINHEDEPICHICHKQNNVFEELDRASLEDNFNERREMELEQAEKRRKRTKRIVIGATIGVVVLGILAGGGVVGGKMLVERNKKINAYNKAVLLVASEDYEKAKKALKQLGDYKDCPELLQKVLEAEQEQAYTEAASLLENGAYSEAMEAFKNMGDYKDSADIAAQLEVEIPAMEQAIAMYHQNDITSMVNVIMNHKYVLADEKYKSAVQLIQPYIGSWEKASGNEEVFSMKEKDEKKYKKYKTFTTTANLLDTGEDAILVNLADFSYSFKLNYTENKLEPSAKYDGGTFELSLTEQGNLLVTLKRHDKKTITCEYKRVQS